MTSRESYITRLHRERQQKLGNGRREVRRLGERGVKTPPPRRFSIFKYRWLILLVLFVPVIWHVLVLDIQVRKQFEGKRWALPARVYARPLEMYTGMELSKNSLINELQKVGYSRVKELHEPGDYRQQGNDIYIYTRPFKFWDGAEPARKIRLRLRAGKGLVQILDLEQRRSLALLRLDPMQIGKMYPTHNEDRILIRMEDVPKGITDGVIAMEDRKFYEHNGISLRGIVRAFLHNLRAGDVEQGGSTVTQQLVKNFYLSPERTFKRKINEAIMSILLEWHYDKDQIMEAYLNEVYLGQAGQHGIHGVGMASWFYFNRPLNQLDLPKQALLVSLLRAASYYNPRKHPERALERRNIVLQLMHKQNMLTEEEMVYAQAVPLGVVDLETLPRNISPYPGFIGLVREQLRRDYREEDLHSEGLKIFTTLDPSVQHMAEKSLQERVKRLEKENRLSELDGAMVVTRTETGEVLAVVGGKRSSYAGYNRALHALRPVGSVIKPAVYLTALEQSRAFSLLSKLDDKEFEWEDKHSGEVWKPRNYDGEFHGSVPLYKALSHSYNLATVQLGFELGLEEVRETIQRLGVEREFPAYPSMLLGGVSLTPVEVTQMYQTIANDGFRIPLRAIRSVLNHQDKPLKRYELSVNQAFDPAPVFVLNHALQRVISEGTGRLTRQEMLPATVKLAGKTGTTNNYRDSWFAGFGSDVLAVVWLGNDDNKTIKLSGGDGAMKVWADFMGKLKPRSLVQTPPNRVQWRWVNQRTNRYTNSKRGATKMPFIVNHTRLASGG